MPTSATAGLLQRAVALHQQGQFDAALALYRQVLDKEPRQADALHLSGVVHRQQGDARRAVELIEQAIAVDPAPARPHCNLGAALADLGQTAQALASYERAIARDPAYALAHANRGNALRTLGRAVEAIASYDQALALNPASIDAASGRAIALNDLGLHHDALAAAEASLRLRPGHVDGWAARGNALAGLGEFAEALASFERAIGLHAGRADLLGWRGGAQFKLGRFADALASFDASLALRPAHAGTVLRRAHALDALGRKADAVAALQQARLLGADAGQVDFALAALGAAAVPTAAPAAYVTALFDQYAGHFDAHLVGELAYRTPALIGAALERTGAAASGLHSVDLGCGTGLCGPLLRACSASVAGVDLSPAMLEQARARGLYDDLACADIGDYLTARRGQFDLIVAADVFVYIGDLRAVFCAARDALRAGGRFCFSVETLAEGDFALQPTRRYAHSRAYIDALAADCGWKIIDAVDAGLRHERGAEVAGTVFVLAR